MFQCTMDLYFLYNILENKIQILILKSGAIEDWFVVYCTAI